MSKLIERTPGKPASFGGAIFGTVCAFIMCVGIFSCAKWLGLFGSTSNKEDVEQIDNILEEQRHYRDSVLNRIYELL